MNVASDWPQ